MPFERQILLAIHSHHSSFLDLAFQISHVLGTMEFCSLLVLAIALFHVRRGEHKDAMLWLLLGLSAAVLQSTLKDVFERERPRLWPRISDWPSALLWMRVLPPATYSFPSGHALATAALYPLLAHGLAKAWPRLAGPAWCVAILLVLFVGFGRLYLGVHWPTDVLAGWAIGAAMAAAAIRIRGRMRR